MKKVLIDTGPLVAAFDRRDPAHRIALGLGFVDTCVMAIAEHYEMPILTFDFADFRATESAKGAWSLAIGENTYMEATGR